MLRAFRVAILLPLAARSSLRIRPGQKLQVLVYGGQLRLIPVQPMRAVRGSRKAIGSDVNRDAGRV